MRFLSVVSFSIAIGCLSVVIGGLPVSPAAGRADAAVPDSITALLGPSLGYLLAQSDLCGWKLNDRIDATYQSDFPKIGMTKAQQEAVRQAAKAREAKRTALPDKATAGMKAGICTSDMRAQVEHDLGE
jgi:hypothetical protein